MGSLGGGGGQSGGYLVQQTAPYAALQGGILNAQAAAAASDASNKAIEDAINAVNKQYINAQASVQPYQTEGVQALDQLNQYLQLKPYNPGVAPTAPTAPTIDSLAAQVTPAQLQQYIEQNMGFSDGHYVYTGANPRNVSNVTMPDGSIKEGYSGPGVYESSNNLLQFVNQVQNTNGLGDDIRKAIAKQQLPQAMQTYDVQNQLYQQQKNAYDQNMDLYNQYTAQGPLTTQQVEQNISQLPGYQAQMNQGIQAIQNAAAAKGYLGSGNILQALNDYGQNTLASFYGNELSRLAGLAGMGQTASKDSASSSMATGGALADLFNTMGNNQANSLLAGGNALAQALSAANQQFNVIGGSGGSNMSGLGSLLGGFGGLIGSNSTGASGLMALL